MHALTYDWYLLKLSTLYRIGIRNCRGLTLTIPNHYTCLSYVLQSAVPAGSFDEFPYNKDRICLLQSSWPATTGCNRVVLSFSPCVISRGPRALWWRLHLSRPTQAKEVSLYPWNFETKEVAIVCEWSFSFNLKIAVGHAARLVRDYIRVNNFFLSAYWHFLPEGYACQGLGY